MEAQERGSSLKCRNQQQRNSQSTVVSSSVRIREQIYLLRMSLITVYTNHNINQEEIAREVGTRRSLCFSTLERGVKFRDKKLLTVI